MELKPPTWRAWKAQNGGKGWHLRAPLAAEWGLEWFVHWLRSLAVFELLEFAGRVTVLVAVVIWFLEADDRAKERHYRAWELINAARGSTGDGGRRDALQDLNRDGVSLAGAPLERANLPRVDLENAELERADLEDAYLEEANLQSANLEFANLYSAYLGNANLQGADLGNANLRDAHLNETNLQGANLRGAVLQSAGVAANLKDAHLWGAYLQGADLGHARGLTQQQLDVADGNAETVLPEGLTRPAHWSKTEETAPQPNDARRAPPAAGKPKPRK